MARTLFGDKGGQDDMELDETATQRGISYAHAILFISTSSVRKARAHEQTFVLGSLHEKDSTEWDCVSLPR